MTDEKKQEFTRRISQANSTDMIVVIYDVTLSYIEEAANAIKESNRQNLNQAVVNIRKCINELIGSLNYDYSPAKEMLSLYIFCSRELTPVTLKQDADALGHIESVIKRLRDAYGQIANQNTSGPVMENSQSVYAGLTYGRSSLNENVVGSGNRGFLA